MTLTQNAPSTEVGPLPPFVTAIEVVGTITPTQLVRSLMSDPKAAMHVYALLGAVLTNEGHLPKTKPAPMSMTFGDAIRAYMFEERMTRREVAANMGISYPYLCELLNDRKVPGPTALKGATAAGIDMRMVKF